METKFVDCFEYEIRKGDDVLIAFDNINQEVPTIYCGIIIEVTEEYVKLVWQQWVSEIESSYEHVIYKKNEGINHLTNIYKFR